MSRRRAHGGFAPTCRPTPTARSSNAPCSSAAGPSARLPLTARRQHIEDRVQDLADVHITRPPAALGRRDHRLNQHPLSVSQVAWIAQATAIGRATVFRLPHPAPLELQFGCQTTNHNRFLRLNNFLDRHLEPTQEVWISSCLVRNATWDTSQGALVIWRMSFDMLGRCVEHSKSVRGVLFCDGERISSDSACERLSKRLRHGVCLIISISVPKLEQSADGCANFWWGAGTLFQFETDGPSMATAYMKFWDV